MRATKRGACRNWRCSALALAEQAGEIEHAGAGDLAHPPGERHALAEPQGF